MLAGDLAIIALLLIELPEQSDQMQQLLEVKSRSSVSHYDKRIGRHSTRPSSGQ
jgi:hypothetical protein